jgi:hypothetical protein
MNKNKDWTGNSNSIYKTLGASNHTDKERQNEDFYATESKAIDVLLEVENFNKNIWECACGQGHLSEPLIKAEYNVKSTDLIDRGYGQGGIDFLQQNEIFNGDIITNPPYAFAQEFIEKALFLVPTGNKVAMFLKIQFLEGKKRKELFLKYPPKTIYVSSSRLLCAKNAEFQKMKDSGGSAVAYAWYIWEKGYQGNTTVKWIN